MKTKLILMVALLMSGTSFIESGQFPGGPEGARPGEPVPPQQGPGMPPPQGARPGGPVPPQQGPGMPPPGARPEGPVPPPPPGTPPQGPRRGAPVPPPPPEHRSGTIIPGLPPLW